MALSVHTASFQALSSEARAIEQDLFSIVGEDTAPQKARCQRISEFVFPRNSEADARPLPLSLILSMLGHLSHSSDSRWLSCIGLPHTSKKECLQSGLDWQRFLQVFPSNKVAVLELTERVLQAGRSHTVVAWLPASLSDKDLARLENAATMGNCQGILIRHR
ncbi:MAG: SulA-like leucine-rich domain-containing protein [Spongiibacteraceae bacterium]